MSGVENLSPRHRDCLRLTYARMTTKEIARELGISPGTVSTYCKEAIAILGATDRREAAQILRDVEHPFERGAVPKGVGDGTEGMADGRPAGRPTHSLGPLAPANRDADNDHSISVRLIWILCLAIGLAVGFGSIVAAIHTINDIVRGEQSAPPR